MNASEENSTQEISEKEQSDVNNEEVQKQDNGLFFELDEPHKHNEEPKETQQDSSGNNISSSFNTTETLMLHNNTTTNICSDDNQSVAIVATPAAEIVVVNDETQNIGIDNGLNVMLMSEIKNCINDDEKPRRVSFPKDTELVTGYLEPVNPWAEGTFYEKYLPMIKVVTLLEHKSLRLDVGQIH